MAKGAAVAVDRVAIASPDLSGLSVRARFNGQEFSSKCKRSPFQLVTQPLLVKLRPDQWQKLSTLLDQALELPPSQRDEWLARIPQQVLEMAPELSGALRKLLEGEAEAETARFLCSLSGLAGESAAEPLPDLRVGDSVGAYRLLRELGRGGMGAVWLAERSDGLLKRPVALKLPHLSGAAGVQRERLTRERDILAALNHPNIARLYDAGLTPGGQPFLALEYVEGRTLLEDCTRRSLGLRERLDLFGQVLEAVKYAHIHLVVHRDLKPSNILVTADGQVKLLDFGIAKLVADGEASVTELTQFGGRAMTPDYASPEQILGHPITTASDVYALGVLLFELLSGERPYRLKRKSAPSWRKRSWRPSQWLRAQRPATPGLRVSCAATWTRSF